MKKTKKFSLILCAVLVTCVFIFAGCSPLFINDFFFTKYTQDSVANETLNIETEGLTLQEKKTKIAKEYINISFTVIIAKKVEAKVYTALGEEVSSSESETFSSFGSGTIIHKGGYILTNYHVIQNALSEPLNASTTNRYTGEITKTTTSYVVYVSQNGGEKSFEATILWSAYNFDLAIIQCNEFADLNAAPMKDRSVYCAEEDRIEVLEEIITVGTQYSQENFGSATVGTISSALTRDMFGSELQLNYEYLIQHDAPINHGNSGGALIDLDGYLIGVNTLGVDNANSLFYAASIYPVMLVLEHVVDNWEKHARITTDTSYGVSGIDKTTVDNAPNGTYDSKYNDYNDNGVKIIKVEESCIIKGIEVDDIIVEIKFSGLNNEEVFEINNTYDFLYARLRLHEYNSALVKVLRNGVETTLTLTKG